MSRVGMEHAASGPKRIRDEQAILADLGVLEKNCTQLDRLDRMLRRFNIFRVLRCEHGEIRHSNMLAWLLKPDESHGLGDSFLRRWLVRVVQDSGARLPGVFSPEKI